MVITMSLNLKAKPKVANTSPRRNIRVDTARYDAPESVAGPSLVMAGFKELMEYTEPPYDKYIITITME